MFTLSSSAIMKEETERIQSKEIKGNQKLQGPQRSQCLSL